MLKKCKRSVSLRKAEERGRKQSHPDRREGVRKRKKTNRWKDFISFSSGFFLSFNLPLLCGSFVPSREIKKRYETRRVNERSSNTKPETTWSDKKNKPAFKRKEISK